VQVVGRSHVSERQWADIRWISARGWAVIHEGWDKRQLSVVNCQLFIIRCQLLVVM
jgi:hypothetical protein